MQYKIGDKVKLKDNLNIKYKVRLNPITNRWENDLIEQYNKLNPKIVTVKNIKQSLSIDYYQFEEIRSLWLDTEIDDIYSK